VYINIKKIIFQELKGAVIVKYSVEIVKRHLYNALFNKINTIGGAK
jgi:hypothetical protein